MACFRPFPAFQTASGAIVFSEKGSKESVVRPSDGSRDVIYRNKIVKSFMLPCGNCVGCRLERSRQWAMRCTHEAQMHENNCFITLTYNDDHIPENNSLRYRDFQLFMKRLREKFRLSNGKYPVIRYYVAGEYGEGNGRPHYHACLFGIDFPDKVYLRQSPAGFHLYRSPILEELWPFGYSSIGSVTFESAGYVARYVMKKQIGRGADYRQVYTPTGEIVDREPEFAHMSLKPGIGYTWLQKYRSDVFTTGRIVMRGGVKCRPPKFYERKFREENPLQMEEFDFDRLSNVNFLDNTPERLEVRETVVKARVNLLKRGGL